MKKSSKRTVVSMMKKLIGLCVWRRLDYKKLFLVGATLTFAALVLPPFISFSTFNTLLQTHSQQHLNGSLRLSNPFTEARIEQMPLVQSRIIIISTNSSVSKSRSMPFERNGSRFGRRSPKRRRRRRGDDEFIVVHPPPRRPISRHLQKHVSSISPHQALVYARKEIEHAPPADNDTYLYGPIFRNFSSFIRSYELMEMMLKVYIYPDGQRPIFHEPHLMGIYASEGWFMKLMEENSEFVTNDPEKAHLFYLPYSSRQLELELYVPCSHNLKPLAIFIKEYVTALAAKYPFWNRTHGSDHFLVACHDWGPYTTTAHTELRKNAVRVLCNADLSEGFLARKDVSLPETAIRNPSRPLRYIGHGNRVSQRPILAFFAGKMHGRVRPILLKYWHNKDEDMKIYGPLPRRVVRNMSYIQHMKFSKYCVCPMGYEVNSPRLVEAIYYECVPVIIADNFILPFSEVLDWSAFSVIVAEKDIPRLKEILLAIPLRMYLKMQSNVKMVQKHFLWNPKPVRYDLFHMILHSIWLKRLN